MARLGATPIPFAGFLAANVNAQSYASGLTLLWRPPLETQRRLEGDYVWLKVVFKF
jgi:hypothetical protein